MLGHRYSKQQKNFLCIMYRRELKKVTEISKSGPGTHLHIALIWRFNEIDFLRDIIMDDDDDDCIEYILKQSNK